MLTQVTTELQEDGCLEPESEEGGQKDSSRNISTNLQQTAAAASTLPPLRRTNYKQSKIAMMAKLSSSTNKDFSSLAEPEDSASISSSDEDGQNAKLREAAVPKKRPKPKSSNKFSSKSILQNKAQVISNILAEPDLLLPRQQQLSSLGSVHQSTSRASVSISERSSKKEQSLGSRQ